MVVSFESFANLGQEELTSLRAAHGKLQKVLSEKASELSHAVRRAELYEREAKKLRHKLEDIRGTYLPRLSAFTRKIHSSPCHPVSV